MKKIWCFLVTMILLSGYYSLVRGAETVGYKDGFFINSEDGLFSSKFNIRLKFRHEYENFDDAKNKRDVNQFIIKNARLKWEGHAFKEYLKYKAEFDISGSPATKDLYLDYTYHKWASLRMGQMKVPYSYQALVSSYNQEFVDRANVTDKFKNVIVKDNKDSSDIRDVGVLLYGNYSEQLFLYELGIYNGNGSNTTTNDNNEFLYAVRLTLNPLGEFKRTEIAFEGKDKPLLTLSSVYIFNSVADPATNRDRNIHTVNANGAFKYAGISLQGEYFHRLIDRTKGDGDIRLYGYYIQGGYLINSDKCEIALRYGDYDPSNTTREREYTVGINHFFFSKKHRNKLSLDYTYLKGDTAKTSMKDHRIRLQLIVEI